MCCFGILRVFILVMKCSCSDPPYLAMMYLVSVWQMVSSCLGSLRTWMNCCLMQYRQLGRGRLC